MPRAGSRSWATSRSSNVPSIRRRFSASRAPRSRDASANTSRGRCSRICARASRAAASQRPLEARVAERTAELERAHDAMLAEIEPARPGGGAAAPGAEDGVHRPAHRRGRARFQQPSDGGAGQPRPAAQAHSRRSAHRPAARRRAAGRPARRSADPAPAGLRPSPGSQARADQPGRTRARHGRSSSARSAPRSSFDSPWRPTCRSPSWTPTRSSSRCSISRSMPGMRCPMAACCRLPCRPGPLDRRRRPRGRSLRSPRRRGQRSRHGRRDLAQGHRALLLDQGARQGHRPRPLDDPRAGGAARRRPAADQRGGQGHAGRAVAAGDDPAVAERPAEPLEPAGEPARRSPFWSSTTMR